MYFREETMKNTYALVALTLLFSSPAVLFASGATQDQRAISKAQIAQGASIEDELFPTSPIQNVYLAKKSNKKKKKLKLGKRTFKKTCQVCHGEPERFAGYQAGEVVAAFSSEPEMTALKVPKKKQLKALEFYFSTLQPQ
jgi:cytochrome c5